MEAAGCCDGGDFLLRLRDKQLEDDWLLEAYKRRPDVDIMHPPQPAHRCVSHLLLLMIRTIEKFGAASDGADLNVTKRELMQFGRQFSYDD